MGYFISGEHSKGALPSIVAASVGLAYKIQMRCGDRAHLISAVPHSSCVSHFIWLSHLDFLTLTFFPVGELLVERPKKHVRARVFLY